jgi:HSP20 family protein
MYQNQQESKHFNPWACGPQSARCGGAHRGHGWKAALAQRFNSVHQGWGLPAANIQETDEAFTISLYAAGIRKEDVSIRIKDDVLEVSYQAPDAGKPTTDYANQEYHQTPWKRGFQLNGKVLTANISAQYTDGVLLITLPKNPETNTKPVTVAVS